MPKNNEPEISDLQEVVIKRYLPPLSYELFENTFKHFQGQVLTVIEATVDKEKLAPTKSLIKGFGNETLTHLFEICDNYGMGAEKETPDYDRE